MGRNFLLNLVCEVSCLGGVVKQNWKILNVVANPKVMILTKHLLYTLLCASLRV